MPNNALTQMDRPALLLTRPQASAAAFVAELDPGVLEGVTVCVSPLLEIVPVGTELSLEGYAGVVLTSANAVRFLEEGAGRVAYCVGARTAEAARARGWRVERTALDADGLIAAMGEAPVEGPLLHLAGQHRRGEVAERLSALGMQTNVAVVYDQALQPLSEEAQRLLGGETPVIVPLFSPRTAAQFVSEARSPAHVQVIAISKAVADAVGEFPAEKLHVVAAPTSEEMRRTVEMVLRGDSLA